ncbi:MAG: VOC family protein [Treponema sp.]|jgi:methylmalonyl-CoA epimerase|nr:VOC family protein [Treponema sp.]
MAALLKTQTIVQVGLIVKDVEKTKKKWAEFLGVSVPATVQAGDFETTETKYKGKSAPKAKCQMAFFDAGPGMQLELIQPNGKKSTWQDFLEKHGEGIHHIAFKVNGTKKILETCQKEGIKCVQQGKYGDASGEYAYLDTVKDLKCVIETLESYSKN